MFNPIIPIERLVLAAVVVMAAGGVMAWLSASARPLRWRLLLACLRVGGLSLLALVAFNPGRWVGMGGEVSKEWLALLDRSASMTVKDAGDGASRFEEGVRVVEELKGLAGKSARMRVKTFATKLEDCPLGEPRKLKPDGTGTDIIQAGVEAMDAARATGVKLTGALVVSDGRRTVSTKLDSLVSKARTLDVPFHVLPIGGEVATRNLAVKASRRDVVGFVGQRTRVAGIVSCDGFDKVAPMITLTDLASGSEVASRRVELERGKTQTVSFELTPGKVGRVKYRLAVKPFDEESSVVDNSADLEVTALDKKIKVLLVEGAPSWDTKFLAQLLRRQPHMEVTSAHRLSAKRYFRVESGSSEVQDSSATVFPDTPEDMAALDVIVFGKGAEYFLTPPRIALLKEFMREHGGCVVFARGKPYSGSFPELGFAEPVEWGGPVGAEFRLVPTRHGADVGLFGGSLPGADDPVWQRLPLIGGASSCPVVKPFSQILAEGRRQTSEAGESRFPVIIALRHGKGASLAVNADGFWKWDFFPSSGDSHRMYSEFWTGLLEWCLEFSDFIPGMNYSLSLSSAIVNPGEPVKARISSRSKRPGATQAPTLKVLKDGAVVQELSPGAVDGQTWEAVFSLDDSGERVVEASFPGEASDKVAVSLSVARPPSEGDNLSADRGFLERLAVETGGDVVARGALKELVARLEGGGDQAIPEKAVWESSWNRWWVLCLAMALFGAEWTIRRRSGLT